jgi:hypothetical protein
MNDVVIQAQSGRNERKNIQGKECELERLKVVLRRKERLNM